MVGTLAVSVPPPVFAREARRLLWTLTAQPGLVVVRPSAWPPPSGGRLRASGHLQSSRLAHYFLAAPLMRGEAVLFLDAANCFDPYRLVAFAHQCRRSPQEFLQQVHISRAFTCFQMAELIERTLAAARRYRARRIFLTGFPDIFDDEELSVAEAQRVFRRSLAVLRGWPAERLTALAFSDAGPRPSPLGHWLRRQLAAPATSVYRLDETPEGLCLRAEKQSKRESHSSLRTLRLCGEKSYPAIATAGI